MNKYQSFKKECEDEIDNQGNSEDFKKISKDWFEAAQKYKYSYHFEFLGRPIIQYPQDIVALQEVIWSVKPDLIIETGIAHGGSIMLSASLLAQLDLFDSLNHNDGVISVKRKVIGLDIDIREHNKQAILDHPLSPWIEMFEGSSIDAEIIGKVKQMSSGYNTILVILDSNHTHDHVLAELQAYASLVSKNSYCIVFDTVIENLDDQDWGPRDWGVGNSPMTAVTEYLGTNSDFEIDSSIDSKLLVSVAPKGYLKKTK